jgi:hypothetical protein
MALGDENAIALEPFRPVARLIRCAALTGGIEAMRFFRIWTHRSPESIFGPASNPVIRNGAFLCFESEEEARAECARLNGQRRDTQVHYTVEPTHIEALLPQERAKRSPIEAPSFSALATAPCLASDARMRPRRSA